MIRIVRDIFIPHPGNGNRPHLLRDATIAGLTAIVLLLEFGLLIHVHVLGPGSGVLATIVANVLVDETNAVRIAEGAGALQTSDLLREAAQRKAEDMAARGYFAHTSPDGITPWHWFIEVGYTYAFAGENLAVNFVDSDDVIQAWLRSPTHRANIVDGRFSEIGIGMVQGRYKGKNVVFVAQLFGRPAATGGKHAPTGTETVAVLPEDDVRVLGDATADVVDIHPVEPAPIEPLSKLERATLVQSFLASPRSSTHTVYFGLGALVLVALLFKLFLRVEETHPRLLVNGLIFLIMITVVLFMNEYLATAASSVM